jgi:hypothetical protein
MLLREWGKKMNRLSSVNKKSFIWVSLPDEGRIAGPDTVSYEGLYLIGLPTLKN